MTKFALIGATGQWAQNYLKNFKDLDIDVSCLCARNIDDKIVEIINEYWFLNGPKIETDYKKVCESKNVDAVIISTPPQTHYDICKCALENNKHVICEKPFVFDQKQASELHNLAAQKNLNLVINYIDLFNPLYFNFKNTLQLQEGTNILKCKICNYGPFRDYSVVWDYGSHAFAMMIDLFNNSDIYLYPVKKVELIQGHKLHGEFNILIMFQNQRYFDITISNVSLTKERCIVFDRHYYEDKGQYNPLLKLLKDFNEAITNKTIISNSALAVKVTNKIIEIIKTIG